MSNRPPPVPPAGRSSKGPGGAPEAAGGSEGNVQSNRRMTENRSAPENLDEQDRQGNTKQNTTHQGYQQDR